MLRDWEGEYHLCCTSNCIQFPQAGSWQVVQMSEVKVFLHDFVPGSQLQNQIKVSFYPKLPKQYSVLGMKNRIVFELSSSCCIHLNWHPSQCIAFDTFWLPDVFAFVAEVRTGIHHHYVWHLALWHCRVSMGGWKSKCGQEGDWLPGQRTVAGKSFE